MNKIKKTVVCLALCMVMLLGSSLTSFAASGSATYGGATATWSMSFSKSTNTVSYKATAKLKFTGSLYVKNNITKIQAPINFDTGNVTKCSYTLTATPGVFSSFVSSGTNNVSAYINNSCFITYKPQP